MRRRAGSSSAAAGGGHDSGGMMRWLLTYADLITLLMVFFVVLYAMSNVDKKKYDRLKSSLQVAMRTEGAGVNMITDYSGQPPVQMDTPDEGNEFAEIMKRVQAGVTDPKSVGFLIDERGLTIRFMDNVLFDSGQAVLQPGALPLLDAVGASLKGNANHIRVEGHTDNVPISNMQYPSNWELSAARSVAVTRYLIEKHNMEPRRLSSLGYGEYHPLVANTSDENRSKNRRVDIVVLRTEKAGGEIIR